MHAVDVANPKLADVTLQDPYAHLATLVVTWLIIGVIAAAQRDYFSGSDADCAKVGIIAVTIVAGPLNYIGVNPKIKCRVPQPSK